MNESASSTVMPPVTDDQLTNPDELNPAEQELHIAIGSVEDVRAIARDAADRRLSDETQRGGGFRGFVRRIWKGSVAQGYYQQKYQREAEEEIAQTGNLHLHTGGSSYDSNETIQTVVSRLTHRHADELISQSAGERLFRVDDREDEPATAVKEGIFELVDRFSSGELNEENFEEEKNRVLRELARQHPELLGQGILFADNLLEIAQNVRAMVRHDRGVRDILETAKIDIGQVKTGVRTEANFNRVDKIVEKIQSTKIGALFSETTVVTAASIVACVTKVTVQKGVAKAAAVTGFLGAGGALIAGMRESKRIKEERRQHSRESAMGLEFSAEAKRRQEIERARYETLSASDLTSALDSLFEESDDEGLRKIKDLSEQEMFEAAAIVAQIKARNRMSDEQNIDLISYSSPENVAEERLQLLLTAIYAETALNDLLEEKGGIDWLTSAGLGDRLNGDLNNFNDLVELCQSVVEASIGEDMSQKDAVFKKIQRNHVLKAALIGGTIGMVIGTASQEAMAHIPGIGDGLYGIGEGHASPGGRDTLLGGIFNGDKTSGFTGNLTELGGSGRFADVDGFSTHQNSNGEWIIQQESTGKSVTVNYGADGLLDSQTKTNLQEMGFGIHDKLAPGSLSGNNQEFDFGHNKFIFPEEYSLKEIDHGQWNILDQNGNVVHEMRLNFDGSLTDESIADLRTSGINVADDIYMVEDRQIISVPGAQDLVNNHPDLVSPVHRTLWYDNDTPAPNFDLNELKLWAGGVNGGWYDEQGNVVFDVSHMKENWSFHGGQGVNPFEANSQDRLSLAISASRDTQATVFDFDFTTAPDGRTLAVIPPDSPVHQLFQMQGDKRLFTGAFAEVMEHTGQQSPTGENVKILSTYVGSNNAHDLTDTILTTKEMHTTTLGITPPDDTIQVITYEGQVPVEAPPVIPIRSRAGLESPIETRPNTPDYLTYALGRTTPETLARWVEARSPRLIENPDAVLNPGEELAWYRDLLERQRGSEYVDELAARVEESEVLNTIDGATKVVVCIPVAAVNESDNIYDTLSLYAGQSDDAREGTVILLNINWVQSQVTDPSKKDKIDKTIAEIERAKRDFPDLKIASFEKEWSDELVERKRGQLFGEVVKILYDTACVAVDKSIQEGRRSGDDDLILLTNDADAEGVNKTYINKFMRALQRYPETDAFTGMIRFGTGLHSDYPGFGISSNLMSLFSIAANRRTGQYLSSPATPGANTGFRISAFAAIGGVDDAPDGEGGAGADTVLGRKLRAAREGFGVESKLRGVGGYLAGVFGKRTKATLRDSVSGAPSGGAVRRIVRHLAGAAIDTNGERSLGVYRKGNLVATTWNDFEDADGYRGRSADLEELPDGEKESTKTDMDSIIQRIEQEVEFMASEWYSEPALVSWALSLYFGVRTPDGGKVFNSRWKNGVFTFEFTNQGKKMLKNQLERRPDGTFLPYGTRIKRQLYESGRMLSPQQI
jgi:hypothetical protein